MTDGDRPDPGPEVQAEAGETGAFGFAERWRSFTGHPGGDEIPVAPVRLSVAARLLADETALWLMARPSGSGPLRSDMKHEVQGFAEHHREQGWAGAPLGFHRDPAPLASPGFERPLAALGRYQVLSFESGYEPLEGDPSRRRWLGYRRNRTARAWVVRSRRASNRWLVCVHGFGMGRPLLDLTTFHAEFLSRSLGINVLSYVLPLHGPRSPSPRSGRAFGAGPCNVVHTIGQAVWDLRRILGWLRARDAGATIGVHGVSLGGNIAALLSTLEADLACVIAGVPAADLPELFRRHYGRRRPGGPPLSGEPIYHRVRELQRVISPRVARPRVPRERLYLYAGLVDRFVPADVVRDLWLHWGRPRIAWYPGNHLSFVGDAAVRELLRNAYAESGLAPPRARHRKAPAVDLRPMEA